MDFIVEERATRIKSTLSPFLEHARVGCEHHYGKSAPAHDRIGSDRFKVESLALAAIDDYKANRNPYLLRARCHDDRRRDQKRLRPISILLKYEALWHRDHGIDTPVL